MAEKSGDNPGRSEGKVRRLKWDNDNMKAAMEAVSSGEMTVSASSRVFKVPRKTLDQCCQPSGFFWIYPEIAEKIRNPEIN